MFSLFQYFQYFRLNIRGSLKNPTFSGGLRKTNIMEGGIVSKEGLGQFASLGGAWQVRGGGYGNK